MGEVDFGRLSARGLRAALAASATIRTKPSDNNIISSIASAITAKTIDLPRILLTRRPQREQNRAIESICC